MKIVAVTACPTGIAHTYMAAEQLEKTAKKLGHSIKVETQAGVGILQSRKTLAPTVPEDVLHLGLGEPVVDWEAAFPGQSDRRHN